MATTRLMPLHTGKGRTVGTAIEAIIDYVENPEKTDNGNLITSWQCDSRVADREFLFSKQQYIRNTGRVRGADDVIAYHLRQSFRPGEITPEEANRLGCELVRRFTKGNHAYIVCTHIDKAHIHNHVIWNSTALDEHSKFRNFWGSTKAVRRLNDTICVENGYSIVENPKDKGKSYDKWLGDQKQPSRRERICYAIDEALAQNPQSFEELLELLRRSGYQVKGGKVPSLLGEGQKRFIRMDTLGAGYTPDDLRAIIAGTKVHTPKKKRVMDAATKPSGSLLIDIQAKLQEGKGAGYARWAKNFNLKQLSQTLIYLEENNLLDRSVLEERTASVTAQYHSLSTKMKSAEQRMAEIKVLQQHIINYAKTRDTYVAYRKAGYSKKFLSEHESEIILHKAAKQFFDEQGLKKLPTVKSLQAEYAQLLSEKKAMYADYQKSREDIPDHHPAIVDKALFDKVQETVRRFSQPHKKQRDYLLKGIVFCGCCDHALSYVSNKQPYFHCRRSQAYETGPCHDLKIDAEELEQVIFQTIKAQLEAVLSIGVDGSICLGTLVSERTEYEKQIEALEDSKQSLFEQYIMGEIDVETYKSEKAACDAVILKAKNAYAAIAAQEKKKQEEKARQSSRTEVAKAITNAEGLTLELVNLLIEKVYVFPDKRIEIAYKVQDLFD